MPPEIPEPPAVVPNPTYGYMADGLVVLHFAFMAFIVFGQLAIIIACAFKWQWGRNPWFRFAHLGSILFVVYEAILGIRCPLTEWEEQWREKAGQTMEAGGTFIGRMFHDWLFWDRWMTSDSIKVMTICFGIIVIQGVVMYPPRWFRRRVPEKK
jgi:Protein of Unknown function (DUF2784)